jgi:hypothetical protein
MLLPLVFALAAAHPAAPATERSYPVSDFHAVENRTPFDVTIRRGDFSVRAEGVPAEMDQLVVHVVRGALRIELAPDKRGDSRFGAHPVTHLTVTLPALDAAALDGSGRIDIDRIDANQASLALNGSGDLTVGTIASREVALALRGSGNIEAHGQAEKLSAALQGSGSIKATSLATRDLAIESQGSGRITARASGEATVYSMGSGDIRITGTANCHLVTQGPARTTCQAD